MLTCQGSPCPQLHRYQAEDFPFQTGHFHCKRINYFKLALHWFIVSSICKDIFSLGRKTKKYIFC